MSGWIGAWGNAATVTNLTVTGSQVISVNTSTDALRITQTGTGNALVVEDSANPDSSPFIVTTDGSVGVNGIPSTGQSLYVNKAITGATVCNNIYATGQIQSNVTTTARYFRTDASTQAATFTLTTLSHYSAGQGSFGLNSTVANQYGFEAPASLTGASNNYGFYGNIAAGAGRYNFYANGTAANYFGGDLTFKPLASATPVNNGDLTFQATSNTSLTIKLKGTDGVVRSVALILV